MITSFGLWNAIQSGLGELERIWMLIAFMSQSATILSAQCCNLQRSFQRNRLIQSRFIVTAALSNPLSKEPVKASAEARTMMNQRCRLRDRIPELWVAPSLEVLNTWRCDYAKRDCTRINQGLFTITYQVWDVKKPYESSKWDTSRLGQVDRTFCDDGNAYLWSVSRCMPVRDVP